jgi:hypothetical protein
MLHALPRSAFALIDDIALNGLTLGGAGLHYVSGPAVYALVGMPSMLGAFVKAPLTSILLLFEITRDYNVLIPVMAGVSASMFTQAELAKLLAPAVPAGTPKWLSLNDGAMLESTLTSKAMVTDFVAISVDTPLLGAARAIADAQAAQALSTCYGIVLEGKDGEVLGSVTLRQVMDEVADVIKPLQIAFSQFDVDGSGEVRARLSSPSGDSWVRCGCGPPLDGLHPECLWDCRRSIWRR